MALSTQTEIRKAKALEAINDNLEKILEKLGAVETRLNALEAKGDGVGQNARVPTLGGAYSPPEMQRDAAETPKAKDKK